MSKLIKMSMCLLLCCILFSCATIISGPKQEVVVNTSPIGAVIFVDGKAVGRTPATLNLYRRNHNRITLRLDGYKTVVIETKKGFNPIVIGNILIGGVVGILVDTVSGAVFTINPDAINSTLIPLPKNGEIPVGFINGIPKKLKPVVTKVMALEREK